METQYSLFCSLDRRCAAEEIDSVRCEDVVRAKREIIDSPLTRGNRLALDVIEGRTTFVQTYDAFSREFRGLRRFIPKSHDAEWNARLDQLSQIVPNVRHFRRRSWLAADNPFNTTLYGLIGGVALGLFLGFSDSGAGEPGDAAAFLLSGAQSVLMVLMAGFGLIVGILAMLKYRARDYAQIHAREAAAYMDLNYEMFRAGDTAAWAACLRAEITSRMLGSARPD